MILPCDCKDEFQDKYHGKGRRVHNLAGKGTKARCTICKKETSLSSQQIKDNRKDDK